MVPRVVFYLTAILDVDAPRFHALLTVTDRYLTLAASMIGGGRRAICFDTHREAAFVKAGSAKPPSHAVHLVKPTALPSKRA